LIDAPVTPSLGTQTLGTGSFVVHGVYVAYKTADLSWWDSVLGAEE